VISIPPARCRAIRRRLLAWYDRARRRFPWRGPNVTPYATWVAEVMLQQTRAATVRPYYARFLRAFPSIRALARARPARVLAAWEGLGYYARARNLHRAARVVVRDYGGRLPRSVEELKKLPGIGAYSAAAIASIAFGARAAAFDGNVRRVVSRLEAEADESRAREAAEALVPAARPGDFNQAMMDLGATVCTPNAPACAACPVATLCRARRAGRTGAFPPPRRRARVRRAIFAVALLRKKKTVRLVRRPAEGFLGGLWELPAVELPRGEDAREALARVYGLAAGAERFGVRHVYSHIDAEYRVYGARLRPRAKPPRGAWVKPSAPNRPVTGATRKVLAGIDGENP